MVNLEFRKTEIEEIDLLIKSRVDYCMRDNPDCTNEEFDLFLEKVKKWTQENASSGNYVGYFGYIENVLVSFAGILTYDLPPTLKNFN
ncbi:MAG TPA: hypothetical protein PK771_09440, partial [Spirochaetota bacterium]|nr:hypothetical protein [Spirochaetota bacterium]